MSLPRYIPTRLLEAVVREVKACFSQESLTTTDAAGNTVTLQSLYQNPDESWKVFPYPLMPQQSIQPWQVNVLNVPQDFTNGLGGVRDSELEIEVDFFFPVTIVKHTAGGNSWLDHIYALRAWMFSGGTYPNHNASIDDPDDELAEPMVALGQLTGFAWEPPQAAAQNAAIVVPCTLRFKVRENKSGVRA